MIELGREALWIGLLIGAPLLAAGLVVALVVGLLQAVTQIQDQTVAFVPKIIAMAVALSIALPWSSADGAIHHNHDPGHPRPALGRVCPPCGFLLTAFFQVPVSALTGPARNPRMCSRLFVPEGRLKIAQRFIAGTPGQCSTAVPKGRLKPASTDASTVPPGLTMLADPMTQR